MHLSLLHMYRDTAAISAQQLVNRSDEHLRWYTYSFKSWAYIHSCTWWKRFSCAMAQGLVEADIDWQQIPNQVWTMLQQYGTSRVGAIDDCLAHGQTWHNVIHGFARYCMARRHDGTCKAMYLATPKNCSECDKARDWVIHTNAPVTILQDCIQDSRKDWHC